MTEDLLRGSVNGPLLPLPHSPLGSLPPGYPYLQPNYQSIDPRKLQELRKAYLITCCDQGPPKSLLPITTPIEGDLKIKNYVEFEESILYTELWAFFSFVLCPIFPYTGVLAIISAFKVKSTLNRGNVAEAWHHSIKARRLSYLTLIFGFIFWLIFALLFVYLVHW